MNTRMMSRAALVTVLLSGGSPVTAQNRGEAPSMTLVKAAEATLAWHPVVAGARDGLAGADAAVSEARSARIPSLSTRWSVTNFEEPMVVAPLHRFDPMAPPEFDETLIQGQTVVSYTLFDGGGRGARIRRAEAGASMAAAGVERSESALLAQVTEVFLRVLTLREVQDAQQRRVQALSAERDRVARFLDEGRAARVELMRAEASLSQARADEASTLARLDVIERELGRLMGTGFDEVAGQALAEVTLREGSLTAALLPHRPDATTPELEQARQRVIKEDLRSPPSTTVVASEWLKQVKDRRLDIGDSGKNLEIEFTDDFPLEKNQPASDFDLTVTFSEGCSVTF